MHGSKTLGAWLVLLVSCGCGVQPAATKPATSQEPLKPLGTAFDAANNGTLVGKVVWEGELPVVEPFHYIPRFFENPDHPEAGDRANGNAPRIDKEIRGVYQAVVFLRRVDRQRSKPWSHAPLRLSIDDWEYTVRQGAEDRRIGFVETGSTIEAVNQQTKLHILRGMGASFFSVPMPDAKTPSWLTFDRPGHVELSSGAGYYWMRAHLFVCDHPYYCLTDRNGRFRLDDIPAGRYELVCWMPSWHVKSREHYPETAQTHRLHYEAPVALTKSLTIAPGMMSVAEFGWSNALFAPAGQ